MTYLPARSDTLALETPVSSVSRTLGSSARDERRLVRRMLAGDERAFDEFAEAFLPALYRFAASRLRQDSDLTRDIVQSTLVKALARLGSFRGEAALLTWLCACCKAEIAAHFRQSPGPLAPLEWAENRTSAARGPEEVALRDEAARLVHTALDLLPARYAQVLEWKYLDRLPVQEIADRLHLGAKAAESLLTRARGSFRDVYERLLAGPGSRRTKAGRPALGWGSR